MLPIPACTHAASVSSWKDDAGPAVLALLDRVGDGQGKVATSSSHT